MTGSVETFDDPAISLALRSSVATAANVPIAAVQMEILPGSVELLFVIQAESAAAASTAATDLSQHMGSPAAAEAMLRNTSSTVLNSVSVNSVDLAPVVESVPSPPPRPPPPGQPPLPPPTPSTPQASEGGEGGDDGAPAGTSTTLIVIIAAGGGGALGVLSLIAMTICHYRRRSAKVAVNKGKEEEEAKIRQVEQTPVGLVRP